VPYLGYWLIEEGALIEGRDFWHSMVFFLKEGVTTRVCMVIFDEV